MNNSDSHFVEMSKGRLTKRLQKGKQKKSISITIRFPREDAEILNEIEEITDYGYDVLIRMLVKRLLQFWARRKKIEGPLYVVTKEQAQQLGLIDEDENDGDPHPKGKLTWLSPQKSRGSKRN